jgi:hypothetical protein
MKFVKPESIAPSVPPRRPNRYLFGEHIFAEWKDDDEQETGEGWTFYWNDGECHYGEFNTDTDENARLLMKVFDKPKPATNNEGQSE